MGNKTTRANEGTARNNPAHTPHIHNAHTLPYWLNEIPTCEHKGEIRNLQTHINKFHCEHKLRAVEYFCTYIDKWVSNEQIYHKLSNHLWKAKGVLDAQITQTLIFCCCQYMGYLRNNILWPITHPSPNCRLCT